MNFDAYQKAAYETALPKCRNLTYMVLGLANEAGEVAGKLKKVLRGDRKTDAATDDIAAELGDVMWYVAGVATQLGIPLSKIAAGNIKKLHDRQLRGKLQGDGDQR